MKVFAFRLTRERCRVSEMLPSGESLLILVLAQDVLVERHIGLVIGPEELRNPIGGGEDMVLDVVDVDIDADRADNAKLLSQDGDCRAFEFPRADVQLIIELVLAQIHPPPKVNQ